VALQAQRSRSTHSALSIGLIQVDPEVCAVIGDLQHSSSKAKIDRFRFAFPFKLGSVLLRRSPQPPFFLVSIRSGDAGRLQHECHLVLVIAGKQRNRALLGSPSSWINEQDHTWVGGLKYAGLI